eukprot:1980911-Amphidinium_carterae.1
MPQSQKRPAVAKLVENASKMARLKSELFSDHGATGCKTSMQTRINYKSAIPHVGKFTQTVAGGVQAEDPDIEFDGVGEEQVARQIGSAGAPAGGGVPKPGTKSRQARTTLTCKVCTLELEEHMFPRDSKTGRVLQTKWGPECKKRYGALREDKERLNALILGLSKDPTTKIRTELNT